MSTLAEEVGVSVTDTSAAAGELRPVDVGETGLVGVGVTLVAEEEVAHDVDCTAHAHAPADALGPVVAPVVGPLFVAALAAVVGCAYDEAPRVQSPQKLGCTPSSRLYSAGQSRRVSRSSTAGGGGTHGAGVGVVDGVAEVGDGAEAGVVVEVGAQVVVVVGVVQQVVVTVGIAAVVADAEVAAVIEAGAGDARTNARVVADGAEGAGVQAVDGHTEAATATVASGTAAVQVSADGPAAGEPGVEVGAGAVVEVAGGACGRNAAARVGRAARDSRTRRVQVAGASRAGQAIGRARAVRGRGRGWTCEARSTVAKTVA